ncbi:MAG: DUF2330 domain-containing protein [Pseudomonadota bacterium]
MRFFKTVFATLALVLLAGQAHAFCGFYVARGDAKLFNEASKVVMMRDANRTVITMVNDFQGEAKDFAMVIPTPQVLKRSQINVTDNELVEHLDAYTAPRLVEYFDEDPCRPRLEMMMRSTAAAPMALADGGPQRAKALGVTIEAEYQVGEYDILILSAEQSDGLTIWLDENGYALPNRAAPVLKSYIDGGMKFFVAKVNLERHSKSGATFLRPIQIAFESDHFMLPIRLGMLNAKGKQDLLLWTLTRKGRVETVNYRTVKMPTGSEIPTYIKSNFGEAYKAMFGEAVKREGGSAVMLEYAWDMAWCDPCAADPLTPAQLRELGVYWVPKRPAGQQPRPLPNQRIAPVQAVDVYVTRLHARYDATTHPDDLMLRVTDNRENFQGRYVLRHAWTGEAKCQAGEQYLASLPERFETEAQTLANLTGWQIADIRENMKKAGNDPTGAGDWWEKLWKN